MTPRWRASNKNKKVNCRYCNKSVSLKIYRSHLRSCKKAPHTNKSKKQPSKQPIKSKNPDFRDISILSIQFSKGVIRVPAEKLKTYHSGVTESFNKIKASLVSSGRKTFRFGINNGKMSQFDVNRLVRLIQDYISISKGHTVDDRSYRNVHKSNVPTFENYSNWDLIKFCEGAIECTYNGVKYKFLETLSLLGYNYFKPYFRSNQFVYRLKITNEIPTDIYFPDYIFNLLESAKKLRDRDNVNFEHLFLPKSSQYLDRSDVWWIAQFSGYNKSLYLKEIINKSHDKILQLNEPVAHSSNTSLKYELSFLTEVRRGESIYFIWESAEPRHATYIFETSRQEYQNLNIKQSIIDILLSPIDNKREKLQANPRFIDGIRNTHRLIHRDHENMTNGWKESLNKILLEKYY